jgi:hypothetical protein
MKTFGAHFRGNYANEQRARRLLETVIEYPELVPTVWGILDPIRTPFDPNDLREPVAALTRVHDDGFFHAGVHFTRRERPRSELYIGLINDAKFNRMSLCFPRSRPPSEDTLIDFARKLLRRTPVDWAHLADYEDRDAERFAELLGPFTPEERFRLCPPHPPLLATIRVLCSPGLPPELRPPRESFDSRKCGFYVRDGDEMRGPHGWLWDVLWFNYFGRAYVELIGPERLRAAGWARVEEVGDGLACFATERIDDPEGFERRTAIRTALEEFYWTPGCKREDKRAPVFDFSEQVAAIPQSVIELRARRKREGPQGLGIFEFAGMSPELKEQAIAALEQGSGMTYDRKTGFLGAGPLPTDPPTDGGAQAKTPSRPSRRRSKRRQRDD